MNHCFKLESLFFRDFEYSGIKHDIGLVKHSEITYFRQKLFL